MLFGESSQLGQLALTLSRTQQAHRIARSDFAFEESAGTPTVAERDFVPADGLRHAREPARAVSGQQPLRVHPVAGLRALESHRARLLQLCANHGSFYRNRPTQQAPRARPEREPDSRTARGALLPRLSAILGHRAEPGRSATRTRLHVDGTERTAHERLSAQRGARRALQPQGPLAALAAGESARLTARRVSESPDAHHSHLERMQIH